MGSKLSSPDSPPRYSLGGALFLALDEQASECRGGYLFNWDVQEKGFDSHLDNFGLSLGYAADLADLETDQLCDKQELRKILAELQSSSLD